MSDQNNDPWAIPEEQSSGRFAQINIVLGEQISKKTGKPFSVWEFTVTPIQTQYQIIIEKYAVFWVAYKEVVFPALEQLISTKIISAMSELEGNNFTKWDWGEYKSRAYDDLQYWQNKNPDRIGTDPNGQYVIKKAIKILDIFATEAEWREAADVDEEQPAAITPVPQEAIPPAQIITSMCAIINNYKHDLPKMIGEIQRGQFVAYINEAKVKDAVVQVVLAENTYDKQVTMLAEINSHFDTPYLTEEVLEIPF